MIVSVGMTLLCTFYMYAPGLNGADKLKLLDTPTVVLFMEGKNVLVSRMLTNTDKVKFSFEGDGVNQYDMTTVEDLQDKCKVKNGK